MLLEMEIYLCPVKRINYLLRFHIMHACKWTGKVQNIG